MKKKSDRPRWGKYDGCMKIAKIVTYCKMVSCIYHFLTPNSRSAFRAGVSLNIHSFIHSYCKMEAVSLRYVQSEF